MRNRRGAALLAVVLLMLAGAALALGVLTQAREALAAQHFRLAERRAAWEVEGCLHRTLGQLSAWVAPDPSVSARRLPPPAESLPVLVASSPVIGACEGSVAMAPLGLALDLNAATPAMLRRALAAHGVPEERVDAHVDILLDWLDPDTLPRPHGCERACAAAAGIGPPRDSLLADFVALRDVPGFDGWDVGALVALFSTEPARVLLTAAPRAVLAALPGISALSADALIRARQEGSKNPEALADLEAVLPRTELEAFRAALPELTRIATVSPDGWLVTIASPRPPATPIVRWQARVALDARGARLLRRRILR